jgi:hypothetical protein
MCALRTRLAGLGRISGKSARWAACLAVLGVALAAATADPADARPRYSRSRPLSTVKKDSRAKSTPQAVTPESEAEEGVPLPERRPGDKQEAPKSAVPLGPTTPPASWSEAEVGNALAECHRLLGDVRFDFKALPPMRQGVCGTPAPIQLKYINDAPRVEVRPGATMSCPLADALDRWLTEVVQPRAKELLDATVIRLVDLAAYDCRPRYNNPSARMSYHAYAEAIDIAEFVTAKGEHINVLNHWNAGDERAQFLRDVHDGGCKIFGTVLGPEANEAHKNHFHVDIAKRRHSAFCE